MDISKNRHNNDHLGVNKIGKNIRKSPLHQPNFTANNNANRQQPQPQVYNISKNDFRNVVQQLTGSPSPEPLPRPQQNPPKPQSMRLQKIRPPPLIPINRPHIPPKVHAPAPAQAPAPAPAPHPPLVPYNNGLARPPPQHGQSVSQFGQLHPVKPFDSWWGNTDESPISAYMRDLQNVIGDSGPRGNQVPPHLQAQHPHVPGQVQPQPMPPTSGLLPNPPMPGLPSPRVNGPAPLMPYLRTPPMNGPALLPSPTSQFLLPSPGSYMNFLSPRSPYPLFSPGFQFAPPLTPNFAWSPMAQSGILGPGPQPLPSPGFLYPLSPSGLFPILSPRWRGQ